MGLADKLTAVTPVAGVPAPAHHGYIPEPEAQAAQPNVMPAHRLVAHLRAWFGDGGHPANVNPRPLVVRHLGPNQVVIQAPEPNPAPPPAIGMAILRRARVRLVIVLLLIAVSTGQEPGTLDVSRVDNAPGTGGRVVGTNVVILGAATQITIALRAEPEPIIVGRPVAHWVDSSPRTFLSHSTFRGI